VLQQSLLESTHFWLEQIFHTLHYLRYEQETLNGAARFNFEFATFAAFFKSI